MVGAWAASKWMIPWADSVGGSSQPGYKASTQGFWAVGAALGSFFGAQMASLVGRRLAYFLISFFTAAITCAVFLFSAPLHPSFFPLVFCQGFVATLFFGWLPLYLPELFPTRVRATGTGIAYNVGRFVTALGVFAAGALMSLFGGSFRKVGAVLALGLCSGHGRHLVGPGNHWKFNRREWLRRGSRTGPASALPEPKQGPGARLSSLLPPESVRWESCGFT
jgi:MFS family permease